MKHFKIAAVALFSLLGTCLLWTGIAQAQQFTANVQSSKVINSSVFSAGRTTHIDGTVNGDVYCAGQDVTISGTIHGDVICAAQKVHISGTIDGSVRVAGQDVTVTGKVGRTLNIAGQQVTVEHQATVGQDAVIAATSLDLNGSVKRDAVVSGTSVKISGDVGRNVRYNGSQLALENGALIHGSVNYTSSHAITVADHATVTGATVHQASHAKRSGAHIFGRSLMSALFILIAFLVFCLFLVWFFPQQIHAVSQIAVDGLGKTILTGFVSLFAFPFLISILAATLIGIPLGILVLLFGLFILMLSMPIAAYYFGSMLWSKSKNPVQIMLLGAAVLAIVYIVPLVGALLVFIAYLIGSGALLLYAKRRIPKPNYKV